MSSSLVRSVTRLGVVGTVGGAGYAAGQWPGLSATEIALNVAEAVKEFRMAIAIPQIGSSGQSETLAAIVRSQHDLSSSVQYLMRSQSRTSSSSLVSALWPLGVLGALAAAWYKWGWDGFGWVSLEQLEENLESVRKYVAEKIQELKEEMVSRFNSVGEMLTGVTQRVEQVSDGVAALQGDVTEVNGTLSSVDRRMGAVEANTERAAQGVDLLCRLVKSSHILDDADATAVRDLQSFATTPELQPPGYPQLPAPQAPQRSSSGFMQALLMPSAVASR